MLGNHALRRGYHAHIYTYNLNVFDPTWFKYPSPKIIKFLKQQMNFKNKQTKTTSGLVMRILSSWNWGGRLKNAELDAELD